MTDVWAVKKSDTAMSVKKKKKKKTDQRKLVFSPGCLISATERLVKWTRKSHSLVREK